MRIDELHKFSDGTLNDARTALDDHLKGIQMNYLPQAIWRSDKEREAAMIQDIDKQLKTRRIMPSLEKSILTDSQVTPTKHGCMTKPYSSHRFIANCFNVEHLKIEVKVRNKREKDKIETKPDQIKKKWEAWRSPKESKAVSGHARFRNYALRRHLGFM
uniref:Uncharacterized protein n=1 Tax=Tanacetum cinerariifolium TaxID=118510 RepID=A0A699ID25_TANCI|nr:hypothetical protein [Tanacetum cinerariifolium]